MRETYLALKLKFVKGPEYETYKTREFKKEHEEKAKVVVEKRKEEEEAPVPLVTHVNNVLHSFFSNVEVNINKQQNYNSIGLHANKSYISNNSKGGISDFKGILNSEVYNYEKLPDENMEAPLCESCFTTRMKMFGRPDGFTLYGKLGVHFFSNPEMLCPNMKFRL